MEKGKSSATKKSNNKRVVKNVNAAKSVAVKTAPKKVVSAPKKSAAKVAPRTVVKKAPIKKAASTTKINTKKASIPKTVVKPTVKAEVKVKVEENSLNKDLVMRSILLVSYTLIIVFLVIGFVDSLTSLRREPVQKKDPVSYIETKGAFNKSNMIALEDASFKLSALDGNYFIYITYSDKNVNLFEKELVNLLEEKGIKDKFYYVNIDEIKNEENVIELVNRKFGFKDALVVKVPTIVYVNNENIVRNENIITRIDDNLIDINDVKSLLDRNGF